VKKQRIASTQPMAKDDRDDKLDPSKAIALRDRAKKTSVDVSSHSHPA
jgi:hypothetical protein